MPRPDEDSLNRDVTAGDAVSPAKNRDRSLGDHSTSGDATSSVSDLSGAFDGADEGMELVDLTSRYDVKGTLGRGGMGDVVLAFDNRLQRQVAIKRVHGEMATNRRALERFLTEAQSIAALNHPSIVHINDFGRDTEGPFLILEYVDGGTLLQKLEAGPLPVAEAVRLSCQILDGLSVAHERGIIHRDIKPANILLTSRGDAKLTDFGLARQEQADTGLTSTGAILGTFDYMPPEQRKDAALTDSRSDLWSLAATLYQMLTGKTPRVIKLNDVPVQLHDVLAKALEDAKADRYQSACEFRDALRSCLKPNLPVPSVTVELEEGICPACGIQNDLNRKFCRKCATSLLMSCLSCNVELPVWDNICGECGGNQQHLLATRIQDLDSQRERAEALRSSYHFPDAVQIASELAALTDVRFTDQKHWAETFLTTVREEQSQQLAQATFSLESAQRLRQTFDYTNAFHLLESVPEPMRSPEMMSYLRQLHSDQEEVDQLIPVIADRVQRRDLVGLLTQVDRAVELQGDRADLLTLQGQLRERHEKQIRHRDEAYENAATMLNRGQAKEALALVQSVKTFELRSSDLELKTHLEKIVAAEDDLMELVKTCKADGVLGPDEVISLLVTSEKYLRMNTRHEKIIAMRDQLVGKIQKDPVRYSVSRNVDEFAAWLSESLRASLGTTTNSIGMQFKQIAAGEFVMGSPETESGRDDDETQHRVRLTKRFYMGVHQVAQEQYRQVMGKNPSGFEGGQYPVETVSWSDAVAFCKALTASPSEKTAGRVYRLPTEAEWEYTCRAGAGTAYSFGNDSSYLAQYAWYRRNSGDVTHSVGQKQPNAWGLYDMHGNVWEWCADWYGGYPAKTVTDPAGPYSGSSRVLRGGSWYDSACFGRCSDRYDGNPTFRGDNIGFRVIME